MGSWLLSGLFPRVAWQVGLGAFAMFSLFSGYQALSGAASCGCFGAVKVNPWITLLAIDLPALIALILCRPQHPNDPRLNEPRTSVRGFFSFQTNPDRQGAGYSRRGLIFSTLILLLLATTTTILALNKPVNTTSTYEILEPSEWIGKELPILEHIDIADQIKTGTWLLLLYHHDCPACQQAIGELEQIARDLVAGNEDTLCIALIEIPPYSQEKYNTGDSQLLHGQLATPKNGSSPPRSAS